MPAYIGTSIEERDEEMLIVETRNEEFTATIEDFSKKEEETRELEPDYSVIKQQIELYRLKSRGH